METISVPSHGDMSKWGSGEKEQENRKEMFSVAFACFKDRNKAAETIPVIWLGFMYESSPKFQR